MPFIEATDWTSKLLDEKTLLLAMLASPGPYMAGTGHGTYISTYAIYIDSLVLLDQVRSAVYIPVVSVVVNYTEQDVLG